MGTSTAAIGAPIPTVRRSHAPAILAIATIARLVIILTYVEKNHLPNLHSLGYENIYIALSLNSGHGFSSPFGFPSGPTALLAPGYPLLIAGVIYVLGAGPAAAWFLILLNTLVSLLTLLVIMAVTRRHFCNRTANIAGLLFAISPSLLFAPLYMWDTCISALILTAAIGLVPSADWSNYRLVLLGLGVAIAILINPALSVALFATLAWSAYRARVFPWVAIVAFLVLFSPWPIRNAFVLHSFVPLRTSFGYELWMGNHPGADGNLPAAMGPRDDLNERRLFLQDGEVRYTQLRKSLAYSYISAHPKEFAWLTVKRFMRFWTGTGEATGSPVHTTYYLSALSIVGLVLLRRRRQMFILYLLPLLLFPIPYYITHAEVRYQFVIDPLLVILAGYACESFLAWCARRSRQSPSLAGSAH
jgi:hypothetical protein